MMEMKMPHITFFAQGVPVPKGSTKAFHHKDTGRIINVQTNAGKQKTWVNSIRKAALSAGTLAGSEARKVSVRFFLPRPKYHYSSRGAVKPQYLLALPKTKPDVDKLLRCVLDALDGVYYDGDQVVVSADMLRKEYAFGNPGALITVEAVDGLETL